MAPSAVDEHVVSPAVKSKSAPTEYPAPLKLSGVLDAFESFDSTPVIGREFPKASLVEWLNAPNSDELIRDLAITSELYTERPITPGDNGGYVY